MFLCLLKVLLRYNIVSGEKSNRKRNCVIGEVVSELQEDMLKPLRPKGQWS